VTDPSATTSESQDQTQLTEQNTWLSSHLLAVLLLVPASGLMPPQLETHDGTDQIHNHSDKQKDDGGGLAGLRYAERSVDAVVEDRVGAETPSSCVSYVDDTW